MQKQKDALLSKLNDLLAAKQRFREQQLERLHKKDRMHKVKQRAAAAESRLAKAKELSAKLRNDNNQRREQLEKLGTELSAKRADVLTSHFPTILRYQSLTYSHVSAMLLREQRTKMRQLLDIMPVRINALRPDGGSPVKVTICNLHLPDNLPDSLWQQQEAVRSLSSALGYLLLFMDLLGAYMGGPLLCEGAFRCSTSTIWSPTSYWSRQPSSASGVLPLYVNEALGTLPFNMTARVRQAGVASFGLAFSRTQPPAAARCAKVEGLVPATGSSGEGSLVKRHAAMKAGFETLQRALACFMQDKALALSLQLPGGWSPFAWLVIMCAVVKRDVRTDGVIVAASSVVAEALGSGGSGADGLASLLSHHALQAHGDDDEGDMEGWDMVQEPFLPPPPSQPDAVEHWTRAMFTDAQRRAAPVHTGLPPACTLPMERIRSIFSL